MENKNLYLVTGGAGFIGSCFVLQNVRVGNKVINLDKLTYSGNLENLDEIKNASNLISLKYANGLRNGANSDTHRCKQLTEHGEERCIKLREVAGFSAVRTIFQIVGPRKILHCLLGK